MAVSENINIPEFISSLHGMEKAILLNLSKSIGLYFSTPQRNIAFEKPWNR
jgi:hypothetical protein